MPLGYDPKAIQSLDKFRWAIPKFSGPVKPTAPSFFNSIPEREFTGNAPYPPTSMNVAKYGGNYPRKPTIPKHPRPTMPDPHLAKLIQVHGPEKGMAIYRAQVMENRMRTQRGPQDYKPPSWTNLANSPNSGFGGGAPPWMNQVAQGLPAIGQHLGQKAGQGMRGVGETLLQLMSIIGGRNVVDEGIFGNK